MSSPTSLAPSSTQRTITKAIPTQTKMSLLAFLLLLSATCCCYNAQFVYSYPRNTHSSFNQINYNLVNQPASESSDMLELDNQSESISDDNNQSPPQLVPNAQAFHHQPQQLLLQSSPPSLLINSQQYSRQQTAKQISTGCQLPPTWTGKWVQSKDKESIRVTNTEISDKGICRDQKGDKFLFESTSMSNKQQTCLMCIVINERHLNVLQYKESSCITPPANYISVNNVNNANKSALLIDDNHALLDKICQDITGDAQLESLFRIDTPTIECPISGQYSFTYDNCKEQVSTVESCVDKKQLNFKYGACSDISGSESKTEVLKCYADWSEGNIHYMIGRVENPNNNQEKDKFRCFAYEKQPDGKTILMASSIEESCYGVNINEGPKLLRLTAKPTTPRCFFPSFIRAQADNWLSVDNSLIYKFNGNSTKYQVQKTKDGNIIEEATCLQQIISAPSGQHNYYSPQDFSAGRLAGSNVNNQQYLSSIYHNHHTPPQALAAHRIGVPSTPEQYQPAPIKQAAVFTHSYQQQALTASSFDTQQHHSTTKNDVTYLVQITKSCYTANYCVKFYKRSNGIVQIDYFPSTIGDNQCKNVHISQPQTQILASTTEIKHQRCPFDGIYTIDGSIESDLSYAPSNIFMCPKQSLLAAQCDNPTQLKIHSRCTQSQVFVKNLNCLASWSAEGGIVRLLLADDDKQRYSAWYKDFSLTRPAASLAADSFIGADQSAESPRRLQRASVGGRLLASDVSTEPSVVGQATLPPPTIHLNIALVTPPSMSTRHMQVWLTRRSHCSAAQPNLSPLSASMGNSNNGGEHVAGTLNDSPASATQFQSPTSASTTSSSILGVSYSVAVPFLLFVVLLIVSVLAKWMIAGKHSHAGHHHHVNSHGGSSSSCTGSLRHHQPHQAQQQHLVRSLIQHQHHHIQMPRHLG